MRWGAATLAATLLCTGLGMQGTFAFWTDTATADSGQIASGFLDITLNGALQGNGGSTTIGGLAMTNMAPGESVAASFPVRNNGTVGLRYTIDGSAAGDLAPGMRFTIVAGSTASNTGLEATATRSGSCSAGTTLASNQTLTAVARTLTTARTLNGQAQEPICVRAELDPTAGNNRQGQTMTASLVFNAQQINAP